MCNAIVPGGGTYPTPQGLWVGGWVTGRAAATWTAPAPGGCAKVSVVAMPLWPWRARLFVCYGVVGGWSGGAATRTAHSARWVCWPCLLRVQCHCDRGGHKCLLRQTDWLWVVGGWSGVTLARTARHTARCLGCFQVTAPSKVLAHLLLRRRCAPCSTGWRCTRLPLPPPHPTHHVTSHTTSAVSLSAVQALRPLQYRLEVYKTGECGWGVQSWDTVVAGSLVCCMIGRIMRCVCVCVCVCCVVHKHMHVCMYACICTSTWTCTCKCPCTHL